jgi:hypothetical protein
MRRVVLYLRACHSNLVTLAETDPYRFRGRVCAAAALLKADMAGPFWVDELKISIYQQLSNQFRRRATVQH